MKQRFYLFRRRRTYYVQDSQTGKQESLRTSDKQEAQRLIAARNETLRQPYHNLALARVYLSAHDPTLAERRWSEVMERLEARGAESTRTRVRRAMASKAFDRIRNMRLIETTGEDFLSVLSDERHSTNLYLRQLHNFALGMGWLPSAVMPPKMWPKPKRKSKRAITAEEHRRIVQFEFDQERRLYYELLWEIGASQTDAARLTHENIDWERNVLSYYRMKLKSKGAPPAQISIGPRLADLLHQLPSEGPLFPHLITLAEKRRATRFFKTCRQLEIEGVTLHSYRYAWAQRAKQCGYPERWARTALGHGSHAVHEAYAAHADVVCPSLETYEEKIISLHEAELNNKRAQTS